LFLLSVAPEDEDAGEEDGEAECEPSSVRDFGESGGEIETVEEAEDDEAGQDDEDLETPDYEGYKGDHAGCEEGDKDNADAVGFA